MSRHTNREDYFFHLLMHESKTGAIMGSINLLIEVNNYALILLSTRTKRNNNHRTTGPAIKNLLYKVFLKNMLTKGKWFKADCKLVQNLS